MKIINGLEDENLRDFGPLREPQKDGELARILPLSEE